MTITKIDCSFYAGEGAGADTSSFIALNPQNSPGSLVVAGSCAVKDSIGSHVACKLALQHFVEGVQGYFEAREAKARMEGLDPAQEVAQQSWESSARQKVLAPETSLEVLETAFRNSNSMVYEFGHKLAAGGRMAASLISLVVFDNVIAAGRVGAGTVYLCRNGEVFPFFENAPANNANNVQVFSTYVGSNSMVAVELASVALAAADVVFVFSCTLDAFQERELASALSEMNLPQGICSPDSCKLIVNRVFTEPKKLSFGMMVTVGPDTIYLK